MPRLHHPTRAALLAAAALPLALAGCGHSVRVGDSRQLSLALTEYQINPENVRAYGGPLTITVRNLGTRTHSLAVTQGTNNENVPVDLPPGASTTVTLNLEAGKYMLRSTVPGDQALGMWGSLDVIRVHRA